VSISLVSDWFWDDRRLSGIFGVNADNDICEFLGPSRVHFVGLRMFLEHSQTFRNFRCQWRYWHFYFKRTLLSLFRWSISLILSHSQTFRNVGVNAENDISDLLAPSWIHFFWSATDSEALTDFQEFLMSRQIMTFFTSRDYPGSIFFGLRLSLGHLQTFRNFWC
jgi:hypothetical protein